MYENGLLHTKKGVKNTRGVKRRLGPNNRDEHYILGGFGEPIMSSSVAQLPINQFVVRLARMTNSVGNAIGSAWITTAGLLAVAGVVGMTGFAIKSSSDISTLSTQQAYIQSDLKDVKSDLREIRRGLDDRREGFTNR